MLPAGAGTAAGGKSDYCQVRQEVVGESAAGQRVDNFLLRHLPGVPKSHVYRLLRSGQVRVDGGRAKPDRRLQQGETVRIPPLRQAVGRPRILHVPAGLLSRLRAAVIYDDDDYLALSKPAGLAVHAGSGVAFGVIEALRSETNGGFLELAHRLDRDTSGVLLLAKTRNALLRAQNAFRNGQVVKRYFALLCGHLKHACDVDAALVRNRLVAGERRVQVADGGRAALSRFVPRKSYRAATFCEVQIFSGRTHQIRVHATALGYPVAGDRKYGSRAQHAALRAMGLKRMFLHAHYLELPATDHFTRLIVNADLPAELQQFLDRLEPL